MEETRAIPAQRWASGHRVPFLTKKLFAAIPVRRGETRSLPWSVSGCVDPLQGRPHAQE